MRWLLPIAVVAVVAGCGGRQEKTKPAAVETTCIEGINCGSSSPVVHECTRAAPGFRTCERDHHSTIERRSGSAWTVIAGSLPHAEMSTAWGPRVWLSPDGDTVLAEWTFPCDSAVAVFVPAHGGTPRIVTGHRDWRKAPISRALGWTPDGKARIRVFGKPGIQLIDPASVLRVRAPSTSC